MDTDAVLFPHCDISGECLLSEEKAHGRYGRPRMTKKFAKTIGVPWTGSGMTIARWVFFNAHPDVDTAYCIVMRCGNNRCVRSSHCVTGVLNDKQNKWALVEC